MVVGNYISRDCLLKSTQKAHSRSAKSLLGIALLEPSNFLIDDDDFHYDIHVMLL